MNKLFFLYNSEMSKQSEAPPKPSRKPVGRPRADGRPHLSREQVFSACLKLIAENGYAATSIRTIASSVNASPASLFNLFGSKDGLLNELIAFAAQPSLDFYRELDEINAPASVKLFKCIYEEVIAVASADQEHAAIFYLPELRQPKMQKARNIRQAMIDYYESLIAAGVANSELVAESVELVAEQVFQLTETSIVGGPQLMKLKPKVQAKQTASFCLRSLLTDRGDIDEIERQAMAIKLAIGIKALPN